MMLKIQALMMPSLQFAALVAFPFTFQTALLPH
jgi:hypothetical protein